MTAIAPNKFEYGLVLGLTTLAELTDRERRAIGLKGDDFKKLLTQHYNTQQVSSATGAADAVFHFQEKIYGKNRSVFTYYKHSDALERDDIETVAALGMHEVSHSLRWQKLHGIKATRSRKRVAQAAFIAGMVYHATSDDVSFDVPSFAIAAAKYATGAYALYRGFKKGEKLHDEAQAYKLQGAVQYLLTARKPSLDEIADEKQKKKKSLSLWQKTKDFLRGYPSQNMQDMFVLSGMEMAAKNIAFNDARLYKTHYNAKENARNGVFPIARIVP